MTHHSEEYKRRTNSILKYIVTVQLFLMVFGGCIFALGVISRPILRITKPDFIPTVRWIVNVMVGAGLVQIAAAAYDIFSGCWKLIWPIYLGISVTALTIFLELAAIGSSVYLYTQSEMMVNEDIVHPWYWVECLNFTSCHETMLRYIHWFVLPQVILAAVTVIFQCVGVLLLGRLVRTIADHFRVLHDAQVKYHNEWEDAQWNAHEAKSDSKKNKNSNNHNINTNKQEEDDDGAGASSSSGGAFLRTPRVTFNDKSPKDEFEMRTATYQTHIHVECNTPNSIIQGDHGYVAGSRVSLDFDKL